MSLFWRVFLMNAGLLIVAALALVVSPATVSVPIAILEASILAVGLGLLLVANYVLLRRAFVPLERLSTGMRNVDLLRPGRRLPPGGEAEIAELVRSFNEMLDRLEEERRESGRLALAAQEAERKRIAAELHDEVGQTMTGVLLLLERLSEELPAESREALLEAQEAVRASLDEVRRIARELRPEMLEHLGLVSALKALGSSFAERTGLELEWRFARDLPTLEPDAELVVYRVAQESLTNIARHADAHKVQLSLERGRDSVVLRVVDDGRGLNGGLPGGGGLRGMRERAVVAGAALAVKRAATGGVEVRLQVPTGVEGS
jgi:two-component system, NarL family, sensor histidine kinase UhpB